MYEPGNPLLDPQSMEGFLAIDKDFALLGLSFLPNVLAPKASRERERCFAAFRDYYGTGGLGRASRLVRDRFTANKRRVVSLDGIAQFNLGMCIGLLVTSVPAIGWTLCHVQSDTALSGRMRRGIEDVAFSRPTVNTPQLILDFPLLLESFVKELLRVQSNNASAQYVLKDTPIQGDDGGPQTFSRRTFSSWYHRRPFITLPPSRVRKLSN
ncbi:cytochrome P450 [Apiospora kogelbergensis]|uniref:cytochrome P450 n=1 Tax=Apiospora kogelbergensis TaxID=1337665 RepID=UPI00312DFF94